MQGTSVAMPLNTSWAEAGVAQSNKSNTADAYLSDCLFPGALAAATYLTTPSSVIQNFL